MKKQIETLTKLEKISIYNVNKFLNLTEKLSKERLNDGGVNQSYYDCLDKLREAKKELIYILDKKAYLKKNSHEYKSKQKKDKLMRELRKKVKTKELTVTSTTYERSCRILDKQIDLRMSNR